MIIKAKEIRIKVKALGKQMNKEAILMLDRHITETIDKILSANKERRITEKTIQF